MTTTGTALKVRLVIPICDKEEIIASYRCKESLYIETRIQLLKNIFQIPYKNKSDTMEYPDLIVTSNNFFDYTEDKDKHLYSIFEEVRNRLQQGLSSPSIKHLILGFDIPQNLNPYNGIPAVVSYWKFENRNWTLDTYILEVWKRSQKCNIEGFRQQNLFRIINIKGFQIVLLSCGDIQEYCHCNGYLIPGCDVIINLAHLNYGLGIRKNYNNYTQSFINYFNTWYKKPNLAVLITTQITNFRQKKDYIVGFCGLFLHNKEPKLCNRYFYETENNYNYTLALKKTNNNSNFSFFQPDELEIFLIKEGDYKTENFRKKLKEQRLNKDNIKDYKALLIDLELSKSIS